MSALKSKLSPSLKNQNSPTPSPSRCGSAFYRCAITTSMMLVCNLAFASGFDVPAVVPAVVDQGVAKLSFTLSSVAHDVETPAADRWIVRVRPRVRAGLIVDYSPRTQTASELDGPVVVKLSDESSQSTGLSLDGNYLATARAHLGADQASKKCESTEYRRIAPMRAVIASGTFDRSRGVIFKLTASPQTVLEGEKTIAISFEVASDWRGGILDIEITTVQKADGQYPWESGSDIENKHHFAVALYRSDDPSARSDAEAVATAEARLWKSATANIAATSKTKGLFSTLASTFDRDASPRTTFPELDVGKSIDHWVGKLIAGKADPHLDPAIVRLPMQQRLVALDYIDARDRLATGEPATGEPATNHSRQGETERVVAAKPPIE
jgi:hypothetical protein